MAAQTCPKCESRNFEAQPFTPARSNYNLMSINCVKCGAVVGVLEADNVGSLLHKLAEKLNVDLDR